MRRTLTVILASDVAGYSRLVAEREEETIQRFQQAATIFSDMVKKYRGVVFNTAGDAILAKFDSAVDATRCAIDIQDANNTQNARIPDHERLLFRVGIAIGDVVVAENGDLLGDGVNIAARLENIAEPGGICISEDVRAQVLNKVPLNALDLGEQSLRNIPRLIRAFKLISHSQSLVRRRVAHRWYLSYNSQDIALALAFAAALRQERAEEPLYFAPESLRTGGYCFPKLAKEIAGATAFVLLIGNSGLGPRQITEYFEAIAKRTATPHFPVVLVMHDGELAPGLPFLRQLPWIVASAPASADNLSRLMDAIDGAAAPLNDRWRHMAPFRGLAAMTEADSDFFFGRTRETVEVIRALAGSPAKLPVLLGNSGVGKSSIAQAGVMAALARQAWPEDAAEAGPWPQAFENSRRWCVLTVRPGAEPVKVLVESIVRTWQFDPKDSTRARLQSSWSNDLLDGAVTLSDLLDAAELHYQEELRQPKPPAFFIYIDQGEELYVRADDRQRHRFSEIIAHGLADPRLFALMSLRSDFLGALQSDEPLFNAHHKIDVPPLREAELRKVVSRPAELLSAHFETADLAATIAQRTAEESAKDTGALPLLSYLLDDMWTQMLARGDGTLRLPGMAIELGRVLAGRANTFLSHHPQSEDVLRRVLTLKLATVREDGEPTRRRSFRSEFSDEEWRLVGELADHPYRLLVTAAPDGVESYAEVAHEAIFRRWDKLRDWIAAEREFLAWRSGLEAARRAWQGAAESLKSDALLMGAALSQAQNWIGKRTNDIPAVDRNFIDLSNERESRVRARTRHVRVLVYVLLVGLIAGLVGWINQSYLNEQLNWFITMRPYMLSQVQPYVLSTEAERALQARNSFRECARDCPEMVVIPAGEFMMGSLEADKDHFSNERPQHKVTFVRPFAVSKFEVTFADWDACVSVGGCPQEGRAGDVGWGRGTRPVIYVSWDDAEQYVAWFSKMTGKTYRLLTEAEWEYTARGGAQTTYSWGDEIGKNNANCRVCGSQWDDSGTAPTGSFAANAFGLYDMHGNVWEWVKDCYHDSYNGASADGSAARTTGDCTRRIMRGGSWTDDARDLRAAFRGRESSVSRGVGLGFRVARTLTP